MNGMHRTLRALLGLLPAWLQTRVYEQDLFKLCQGLVTRHRVPAGITAVPGDRHANERQHVGLQKKCGTSWWTCHSCDMSVT